MIPLTVLPETLQIPIERLLKVIGKPDDAVAFSTPVPLIATNGALPKVMLWLIRLIVKLCVACGAALVLLSPD